MDVRIYNKEKLVAHQVGPSSSNPYVTLIAEDGVDQYELPLTLFGFEREVTIEKFFDWIKTRCFPKTRYDKEAVLERLGLKEYDAIEICRITHARLRNNDDFWVDFCEDAT